MLHRAAAVLVLGVCAAAPAKAAPQPEGAAFQAVMTQAVDAAAAAGLAGEVLVADRTGLLYRRAISFPRQSHRPGELWRWASVTKQLTATLVMQQVAEGHLSLDDRVAGRLPAFRGPTASQISVRMLLQHQSGLPNPDSTGDAGPSMPAFYRVPPPPPPTGNALGFCAGSASAPTPDRFVYNNCDYIVLGALLEAVTGVPFARLLQDRIAKPLGLRSLRMAGPTEAPQTVAGFTEAGKPEAPFLLGTFGASGGAIGTPEDLLAFDQALLNNRLLPGPATAIAWSGNPKLGYEALGVWSFRAPLKGCKAAVALVERRGEIGGVEVRNLLAPELGRALVIFADRAGLGFGEIWQGCGLTASLASAAFCA